MLKLILHLQHIASLPGSLEAPTKPRSCDAASRPPMPMKRRLSGASSIFWVTSPDLQSHNYYNVCAFQLMMRWVRAGQVLQNNETSVLTFCTSCIKLKWLQTEGYNSHYSWRVDMQAIQSTYAGQGAMLFLTCIVLPRFQSRPADSQMFGTGTAQRHSCPWEPEPSCTGPYWQPQSPWQRLHWPAQ